MRTSNRLVRILSIVLAGGVAVGLCLVALAPGVTALASGTRYTGKVAPSLRALEGPTVLYDAAGNVLDRLGNLDRQPVRLADVPQVMVDAVIATEDRTFFTNPGVDLRSSVRALATNVDEGEVNQGGSTITQQLIKNRYFRGPKQDLDRKVREAVLAVRLTNEWSKRRILEEYLNTVYFGENAYGVNAAALRIVGKPLAEIGLADAALLAGLIKDPTEFDPFENPEAAAQRRTVVLEGMIRQRKITRAEAKVAAAAPLRPPVDCAANPFDIQCRKLQPNSVYSEEVKNRLVEIKELGATEQDAAQRIFAGGLRVYTAFNPRLAWLAEEAVQSTVGRFAPFTASMAVMDPRTGEVPAIVGGRDPLGFNLATMGPTSTNGRFVGSIMKPITLATAIENGYSPKDLVDGRAPCDVTYEPWGYTKGKTKPFLNSEGGGGGFADLYSQTKNSVNCAYWNLFRSVGGDKVIEMAQRLGLTRPVAKYPSVSIGDTGHSPLEMVTAYSTFAADGVRRDPVFIRRVEDADGRVLYRAPGGRRVLDSQDARTVTDVLSQITEGTGGRARLSDRPIAGKTGTRDNSEDAWFAGYTPQLAAVVWMGDPAELTPMTRVGGIRVFGGTYPAMIWQKFMSAALKGSPVIEFLAPDPLLWPRAASVNPKGGRGGDVEGLARLGTTTTSSTLPIGSTTSSRPRPTTTTTASTTTTTTTTVPPGP